MARDIMKARARRAKYRKANHVGQGSAEQVVHVDRSTAEFDPRRDGLPIYSDLTAIILGDPPIGRRAIDQLQTRGAGR